MAPKIAGVVVAFFQNLHYVYSYFRASLVSRSSYCVKFLSKFFDFCQGNHEYFSIVGNCKLCLPLLGVGVLAPEIFPYPGRIQCYLFVFLLNVALDLIVFFLVLFFLAHRQT
jgi:hypothetical protein